LKKQAILFYAAPERSSINKEDSMLGAIAGDIIGSRFEGSPFKDKGFELFSPHSRFTDDTVLTAAVAESLMTGTPYWQNLKAYFRRYPHAGYGGSFAVWAASDSSQAYSSFGNGSAMRVSPIGWFFQRAEDVLHQAEASAAATHNHPEGIKGAQAVALAIFLARKGSRKEEIRQDIQSRFGYDLSRTLESIRPWYRFDVTCQGSVPEALIAFFEASDYEDAVRNAVSLGGDSDTQACMAGSVAEAFFGGVPQDIARAALNRLDNHLRQNVDRFTAHIHGEKT
jgi:ADP-ribosylglycohydrolase